MREHCHSAVLVWLNALSFVVKWDQALSFQDHKGLMMKLTRVGFPGIDSGLSTHLKKLKGYKDALRKALARLGKSIWISAFFNHVNMCLYICSIYSWCLLQWGENICVLFIEGEGLVSPLFAHNISWEEIQELSSLFRNSSDPTGLWCPVASRINKSLWLPWGLLVSIFIP